MMKVVYEIGYDFDEKEFEKRVKKLNKVANKMNREPITYEVNVEYKKNGYEINSFIK